MTKLGDSRPQFNAVHASMFGMLLGISFLLLWGLADAANQIKHITTYGDTAPSTTALWAVIDPPIPPTTMVISGPATVQKPAERGVQQQVTPTLFFPPTTTTLPIPDNARCPQWWPLALEVGWTYDELLFNLDRVMWGESRCDAAAWVVDHDDTGGGLLGLNVKVGIGTRPMVAPELGCQNTWDCDYRRHLTDPAINLRVGLVYRDNAVNLGKCPWWPWTTAQNRYTC